MPWRYVISDLKSKEVVGTFYKKELQKTNQKESRVGKAIKRIGNKLYVQWKGYDSSFNSCIDKKRHSINERILSRTKIFRRKSLFIDLSNYARKADSKSGTGVDKSKIAKKVDLANLKPNLDKLDIDKLKKVPGGLSSLENQKYFTISGHK